MNIVRSDIEFALNNHTYLDQYRYLTKLIERTLRNTKKVRRAYREIKLTRDNELFDKLPITRPQRLQTTQLEFTLDDLGVSKEEWSKMQHAIIVPKGMDFLKGLAIYLYDHFHHLSPNVIVGTITRNGFDDVLADVTMYGQGHLSYRSHAHYLHARLYPFKVAFLFLPLAK